MARCYRHLPLQTQVKHAKRVWSVVRKVKLDDNDVLVCYGGTQFQDGLWSNLKHRVPQKMNIGGKSDHDNLETWAAFWVWRDRRSSKVDLFAELGATVAACRDAGECLQGCKHYFTK